MNSTPCIGFDGHGFSSFSDTSSYLRKLVCCDPCCILMLGPSFLRLLFSTLMPTTYTTPQTLAIFPRFPNNQGCDCLEKAARQSTRQFYAKIIRNFTKQLSQFCNFTSILTGKCPIHLYISEKWKFLSKNFFNKYLKSYSPRKYGPVQVWMFSSFEPHFIEHIMNF